MNAKGLHLSSGKKKKRGDYCLVFTSYIKYGIREFHDFRRAKTAKKWAKKGLLLVQSCCFTSLNLLEILPFSLRSPWSLLNLLPLGRRLTWTGRSGDTGTRRWSVLQCFLPLYVQRRLIDLSRIPLNKGTNSRLGCCGWIKYSGTPLVRSPMGQKNVAVLPGQCQISWLLEQQTECRYRVQ